MHYNVTERIGMCLERAYIYIYRYRKSKLWGQCTSPKDQQLKLSVKFFCNKYCYAILNSTKDFQALDNGLPYLKPSLNIPNLRTAKVCPFQLILVEPAHLGLGTFRVI